MRNKRLVILLSVLLSVTLLVVFNSVLFSVRHVSTHCINRETSQYESEVLSHASVKKGTSIFFVDKSKVVKNVETSVTAVRVLNVEKMFPNRICINFVEIVPYLRLYHDDGEGMRTYYLSNDMRVMSAVPGIDESENAITLKTKDKPAALAVGQDVRFADEGVQTVLTEIFYGLERLGIYEDIARLFSEIDLTGKFIDMRTRRGMWWRFLDEDELAEKLRFALSVYYSREYDKIADGTTGMLTVTGKKNASYSSVAPKSA